MSVKFHEAFSLDSARRRFHFSDHFLGDSLRDLWTSSGASVVVINAQDGGIVRLTTGAVATNTAYINWSNIRSLHVNKKVTIEVRAKLNQVTQCVVYPISLYFDSNNQVYFRVANVGAAANYFIHCTNGGVQTSLDSGVLADTSYHVFRIEAFPTGEVHFYIDGVECANSPITTNIPSDAGDYLQPFMYVYTSENVAKSMDVDYVWIRQDR